MRKPLFALVFALTLVATACGNGVTLVDGSDDSAVPPDNEPPLGGGPYAVATLEITVEHPDRDPILYELACFGDTATLTPEDTGDVSAAAACTSLADVAIENYLVDGPPSDQACTEIYGGPDTAHLVGRVNDRPVDIVVDRTNGCGINTWDVLLADVLPPAVGVL